jgi:hypothetical protein
MQQSNFIDFLIPFNSLNKPNYGKIKMFMITTFLRTVQNQKAICWRNINLHDIKKLNQSHYRPEMPGGFQEVKVPRLRNNSPGWW